MGRRLKVPIILGAGLFAALAAAAAFSTASVLFRSAERDGDRVAEVLIGESVVIVLRTSAGEYCPLERAEIVANRLRSAMDMEFEAGDVEVGLVGSGHGVFIADRLIVAVYEEEAEAHGATPEALAQLWRDNIVSAVGLGAAEEPPAEEGPPAVEEPPVEEVTEEAEEGPPAVEEAPVEEVTEETEAVIEEAPEEVGEPPAAAETVDWSGTAQKWVPIFSLETEGLYVGAAQVAGAESQVAKVKGVAQLRLNFQNIGRIYAYIPVSTISLTKLDRVQGVSVWAIGDYELVDF